MTVYQVERIVEMNSGVRTVGAGATAVYDSFSSYMPSKTDILIGVFSWIGMLSIARFEADVGCSINQTRHGGGDPIDPTIETTDYFAGFNVHRHTVAPYMDGHWDWFPNPIQFVNRRIYAHAAAINLDTLSPSDIHFAVRLILGRKVEELKSIWSR